jgi:hypothetical protein
VPKNVFESSRVGALMDVGQRINEVDSTCLKEFGAPHGHGFHDFINGEPVPRRVADVLIDNIARQDPSAWSSVARAALLRVQSSETHEELMDAVRNLAAISVSWFDDVSNRNVQGIEP